MAYNDIISRTEAGADIPREVQQLIAADIAKQSTVLSLGTQIPTTTKDSRIPVLVDAPEAYWLTAETGAGSIKQTSQADMTRQTITAEELALIVPIPDPVISDSGFDLWNALRPLFARACARTLDAAVLFGVNKPTSWTSLSVVNDAITAGNWVFEDTSNGAKSLMQAAQLVGEDGYGPTGAVLRHGYEYRLGSQKSESLVANPAGASSPFPLMLGGLPLRTNPVYWLDPDFHAIVGDWSKVLIGMRQDLKVEFFNTGVITDSNGSIQFNLLQQDMTAARVTMRVGYLLAKTTTNVNDTPSSANSPFAVLSATSGYSYS